MESTSTLRECSPQARCNSRLPTVKLMVVNKEVLQLMQTRDLPQHPVPPYHARIVPGWLLCLIIINVCHRAFTDTDLFQLVKALGLERW